MKLSLTIIKFLFIGMLFIVSNNNLYLKDTDDRQIFLDSFYSWINGLLSHAYEITGYVINSEWLPSNNNTEQE